MRLKRVVITGTGSVSPFGRGSDALFSCIKNGQSGIRRVETLEEVGGLGPRVAGLVPDVGMQDIPRKTRRSMSPMSAYAYLAAIDALAQAALPPAFVTGGRLGVAVGSTIGSPITLESFFRQYLPCSSVEQMKSMLFFRIMGHTAAANVAQALGATGMVLAPSSACSSGCQAIGLGYEAIAMGRQDCMLCGGTDEYHPLVSATFDIMQAASTAYNDHPKLTPRPFDCNRDGVVCSEGAGVLLLESLESAKKRSAPILGEILGFASNSDAGSIAEPTPEPITVCMRAALDDAGIRPEDVEYVNAHATGTELGDIAESQAIAALFGGKIPVSSLKGHLGHTMAASGALETIAVLEMLRHKLLLPTLNLVTPDSRCSGIYLLQKKIGTSGILAVKNSFALGGINCTLVVRGTQ